MKKLYSLATVLAFGALANAQQLLSEPFNFSGSVSGNNGWSTHSGNIVGQITTTPGSLTYPNVTTIGNSITISSASTEDINKGFAAQTGTVYFSALIKPLNTTGLTANSSSGDYFLHFGVAKADGAIDTIFPGRLYIKKGAAADTFVLGVLNNSGGTATPTYAATEFSVNTTVRTVVSYNPTTNTATLYLNPQSTTEPVTPSAENATGTAAAPKSVSFIAVREGGSTGNIQIDEITVGNSFTTVLATLDLTRLVGGLVKNTSVENTIVFGSKSDIKIFDMTGKLVKAAVVNDGTALDVSSLADGIYIVTGEVNGTKISQKILKK